MLSQQQRRNMRGIGHQLRPIVQVGAQGLKENVVLELDRCLHDHELIKVQLPAGDPKARTEMTGQLVEQCGAELVQKIGRMILIYRSNPNAKENLSNLKRRL